VRDVLIIGSGAGGGPLALALSEAGLDVLVLEKGPRHRQEEFAIDEVAAARGHFWTPSHGDEPHQLVRRGTTFAKPTNLGWVGNCVGGGTVRMSGYLYRFHPDDFHMHGRFGTFESIADWPYTYDELEPYYCRAEWAVGVSGLAGSNPFEGQRSKPFPMPPLDSHPITEELDSACQGRGLHAYPTPRANNSIDYGDRPACRYCGICSGVGCKTGARGSVLATLLPRAEQTGRCEVRPRSMVREITVDKRGAARGCIYVDAEDREHEERAAVVCVCCSSIESARLLLLSKSPLYPNGLANGNGQVGRNLQFHAATSGYASWQRGNHAKAPFDEPHPFLERSAMDHYFLPEGVSGLAKGGIIRFGIPGAAPIASALRVAHENGRLLWGAPLKKRLQEYFLDSFTLEFEVFHDFIPNPHTFIELDPESTDRWGLPAARIHLSVPDHHRTAGRWLAQRAIEVFDDMGADKIAVDAIGQTASFLVQGTCRAGTDPTDSVVNGWCQAHEVPNLFVVDGSFMPTSGGAPPTLTILANSFRTADHILERRRKGELQ